jgi:hypothetical protein
MASYLLLSHRLLLLAMSRCWPICCCGLPTAISYIIMDCSVCSGCTGPIGVIGHVIGVFCRGSRFLNYNFLQFAVVGKNNYKIKVEKAFFFIFMSSYAEMRF